jgi:hypothetical protein
VRRRANRGRPESGGAGAGSRAVGATRPARRERPARRSSARRWARRRPSRTPARAAPRRRHHASARLSGIRARARARRAATGLPPCARRPAVRRRVRRSGARSSERRPKAARCCSPQAPRWGRRSRASAAGCARGPPGCRCRAPAGSDARERPRRARASCASGRRPRRPPRSARSPPRSACGGCSSTSRRTGARREPDRARSSARWWRPGSESGQAPRAGRSSRARPAWARSHAYVRGVRRYGSGAPRVRADQDSSPGSPADTPGARRLRAGHGPFAPGPRAP